mmetsp:Transcript_4776/g.10082  ORF Transcript_4776/g.10082 Transcript_4776/m.10082 type:complete len:105 (-) Transcript_4776:819-1133(-)
MHPHPHTSPQDIPHSSVSSESGILLTEQSRTQLLPKVQRVGGVGEKCDNVGAVDRGGATATIEQHSILKYTLIFFGVGKDQPNQHLTCAAPIEDDDHRICFQSY